MSEAFFSFEESTDLIAVEIRSVMTDDTRRSYGNNEKFGREFF